MYFLSLLALTLISLSACYITCTSLLSSATIPVYSSPAWSFFYFSTLVYNLFFFSMLLYLIPNIFTFTQANNFKSMTSFDSVDGLTLLKLFTTPLLLMLLVHVTWSGPCVTAWFGHITFSFLQSKLTPLLITFFFSYLLVLTSNVHYSSTQAYDFTAATVNFFVWLWLLPYSNNLFTFIFFLELLSTLVMLILITSTFSSLHTYNTLKYSQASYFQNSTPTSFLQTLLMFFWTTLVASLFLFVFLIFFYLQFLTFDWNITSSIFTFLLTTSSLSSLASLALSWFLILFCIFLKCGIVPFYLWKPAFFRGMTLLSLFFYIYIYYFTIFFYFVYVIFLNLNELFTFNLYIVVFLVVVGTLALTSILFESFYIKAFLALSSILNSLLIFYALCSLELTDLFFVF